MLIFGFNLVDVVLSKFKVHACCTESDKRNTFPCFSALYLTQLMTAPPKKTKHLGNREKQICLYAISINIKQVVYDVISFKSRDKNQTLPGHCPPCPPACYATDFDARQIQTRLGNRVFLFITSDANVVGHSTKIILANDEKNTLSYHHSKGTIALLI